MKTKGMAGLIIILLLVVLGGCGQQKITSYDSNTMIIGKDDTIRDISIEDFTDGDYNMEELDRFVNDEISKYNAEAGGEKITLAELNTENQIARLQLNYVSMEDYNRFNHTDYSLKSFAESSLSGNLISVADQKEIPVSEIADKGYRVLSVSAPVNLDFDGKPLYYNSNISLVDGVYTSNGKGTGIVVFK